MRKISTWALSLIALVMFAGPVAAGPTEDAAREAAKKGTAAYNLGHFEEAARHYEEAYRQVQDPSLLYNIGQSYRLGGVPERALFSYKAFLRTAAPDAPNRRQVEQRVTELERIVSETRSTQAAPPPGPMSPPATATSPSPVLLTAQPDITHEPRPVYRTWWFWTGVGAVVVAGVLTGVVLSSGGGTKIPGTPLGNQAVFR